MTWRGPITHLPKALAVPTLATLAACSSMTEVDDPFYIGSFDNPDEVYLFRCLEAGKNCAVDGLPGPGVVAAGADGRHVVVRLRDGTYVWFRRIAREKSGWGTDPEKLIGPLSEGDFRKAQQVNGLPEPLIAP